MQLVLRLHFTHLVWGCVLSPLESIDREGRGTGLAAQHRGGLELFIGVLSDVKEKEPRAPPI